MDGALNRSGERKQNSAASMSGFTGELSNNNDDGSENITKKKNFVLSNSIASIWNRSVRHMYATFPGVEFLRDLSMFK